MAKCAICEKGAHFGNMLRRCLRWQNVQFVERALISEIMSAILIEDQIMFGSQTLRRFLARSMEFHRSYMYVLHV